MLEPLPYRGDRAIADMTHLIPSGAHDQPDPTDRDPPGDGVLFDLAFRRRGQLHLGARALDRELYRISAAHGYNACYLAAVGDQLAVDAGDQVTGQEPGSSSRRIRLHLCYAGRTLLNAHKAEQQGKNEDSQHKIGKGPASDDQSPLPYRLEIQVVILSARSVGGDQFLLQGIQASLVRHARRVQITGELDVAAQWQPTEPPFDALLVRALENGASEPDGEALHLHAEGARGQEVAQFMDGDDQGQHQQERHDIDQGLPKNS
ncbi:hypothetical protein D3C85_711020 [compost metagenome]